MVDQSVNSGEKEEFLRFNVATDYSDHHYRNTNIPKKDGGGGAGEGGGDCFTNGSSKVYKKIMQEWKILEKNLPDTITVRVYEQRIDLLRAVIVGAAGTPYHDGLFFFDISFPLDYPNQPPNVYYRSFGYRMNPNLYTNGRVCLSLLNTWFGYKNERWDPTKSTVLQLLVSIQGLVLNDKPFANEPGFGGWVGRTFFHDAARSYSENVFVLSCKTMLILLRNPPRNFEGFVAEHVRKRGKVVLGACKAYANGEMRVGYYREDDGSSSSSASKKSVVRVSGTFKASMEILHPQLFNAFTKTGASLGHFVELEKKREIASLKPVKTVSFKPLPAPAAPPAGAQGTEKVKLGITTTIIGKIKKIFGLKKKANNNANKP